MAPGEVIAVVAIAREYAAGHVASQPALAHDVHRLALGQLVYALSQLVHGDVHKVRGVASGILRHGAGIQQSHAAVPGQLLHLIHMELLHQALGQVLHHEARHIHRVLGGGVGGSVGQVQGGQLRGFHAAVDGGGQHVYPLIHALIAHYLGAQQPVTALFKDYLQGQHLAAGIVSRVAHGGEDHLVHVVARLFGVGLVEAGGGGGHVKELEHGAALGAGVAAVPAADIVRGDAPLLVRRARQRYHRILAGDIVLHLHRISHGVDIRVGGLHPLVHNDAALEPQLQPGLGGQAAVGADAYGQHHHVRMEGSGVLQQHVHAPVLLLKALHGEAQSQLHPVAAHLVVDIGGHVGVEGVHQLFGPLDYGHIQAQLPQVLRQLQAYEAAPRQHGGSGLVLHHIVSYLKAVLHGT